MSDDAYIPTQEEKVEIDAIKRGMRRSEKIHEMTQKIEDGQRENLDEEIEKDLDEDAVC